MATEIVISFLDLDDAGAKEVEEDGVKVWLIWCKYCRRWHVHGAGEGHRIAPCKQRTPYTVTGYNLALAAAFD